MFTLSGPQKHKTFRASRIHFYNILAIVDAITHYSIHKTHSDPQPLSVADLIRILHNPVPFT